MEKCTFDTAKEKRKLSGQGGNVNSHGSRHETKDNLQERINTKRELANDHYPSKGFQAVRGGNLENYPEAEKITNNGLVVRKGTQN